MELFTTLGVVAAAAAATSAAAGVLGSLWRTKNETTIEVQIENGERNAGGYSTPEQAKEIVEEILKHGARPSS